VILQKVIVGHRDAGRFFEAGGTPHDVA